MKTTHAIHANAVLSLVAAFFLIAAGCRSDQTAEADPGHAHIHDEPVTATVSGRVSGFDCAVVGELCPTTHRGGDYTTGVYTDDGSFYFVVNIPQSFLSQHFLETIEVEGRVYSPYDHAVEPEVIQVVEDGSKRTVYESGYFIDEDDRRATFHEGRFENGRWVVP